MAAGNFVDVVANTFRILALLVLISTGRFSFAQKNDAVNAIDPSPFADAAHH